MPNGNYDYDHDDNWNVNPTPGGDEPRVPEDVWRWFKEHHEEVMRESYLECYREARKEECLSPEELERECEEAWEDWGVDDLVDECEGLLETARSWGLAAGVNEERGTLVFFDKSGAVVVEANSVEQAEGILVKGYLLRN